MFLNVNMNNNHSVQSLQLTTVDMQPDYRTLLTMKRNSSRPPAWKSFDSSDSDETDGSDDDSSLSDSQYEEVSGQASTLDDLSVSEVDPSSSRSNGDISLTNSDTYGLLKITVTEQRITKCMQVNSFDTVWAVKQRVIKSLVKLRYKRRIYHQVIRSARDSHRLLKMQGDTKRKELMKYIRQQQVEKMRSLMKKGVDPNFHFLPTRETPLIAVVNHPNSRADFDRFTLPALKALIAGQAHLDFRNHQGFTPVHVAAQNGNLQVLEALLGLGAHPDVLDNNDLSPLYHCTLSDASTNCIRTLSQAGARLDCTNAQGWTVFHQVCRYGRLTHLEILFEIMQSYEKKDSLLNAQNDSGNTALHVCAIYKQEKCLVTLLRHGVDPTIRNYSHQDAAQIAAVARNVNVANLINDFPNLTDQEISLILNRSDTESNDFSASPDARSSSLPDRRHTLTSAALGKNFLNRTLQRKNPFLREKSKSQISLKKNISVSPPMPRQCNSDQLPKRPQSVANTIAVTKERQEQSNTIDTGYFGSSNKTIMYIACDNYEATNPQQVSLKKGEKVTVSALESFGSIVPAGFCKVTVGKNTGLVPKSCIQAVKLRKAQSQISNVEVRQETGTERARNSDENKMLKSNGSDLHPTSNPDVFHQFRDVTLSKGANGFGFVLRGAKADKSIEAFVPTPKQPGLQYLEAVEGNGNAYLVGLRADDFIIKINGTDVRSMGHKQVVDLIRRIGEPIHLNVVSVVDREGDHLSKHVADEKSSTASSMNDVSSTSSKIHPSSSQGNLSRSGSIRSALGKLDSVLAMEDGSADEVSDETTATLRRRPISRRLLSQDIQGTFPRQEVTERPKNNIPGREVHSLSSATSRRLVRVVAPKLPNADSEQKVDGNDTRTYPPETNNSPLRGTSFHGGPPNSQTPTTVPSQFGSAKKPPPPPQRRSSRLSTLPGDEQAFLAQDPDSQVPRLTSPTSQSLGRGFVGRSDLSGIAATVALQAQQRRERLNSTEKLQSITHHLISKPPPVVAPKPGRGKPDAPISKFSDDTSKSNSAFAIALAAKQANMKNRNQLESPLLGRGPVKACAAISDDVTPKATPQQEPERIPMELPPPPPTDVVNPVLMNLPPPPPPSLSQSINLDEMILPPPPDDLIAGNIPPPPEFSSEQTAKNSPTNTVSNKFKGRSVQQSLNGVDSLSNADSGVDELALNPRSQSADGKSNIETLSVVSSLSTVSSEEGSDAGVSLSYDPKSTIDHSSNSFLDVLKKAKAAESGDASLVLRKVNFSGPKVSPVHSISKQEATPPSTSDAKMRVDVTKLSGSSSYSETGAKTNDVTALNQKPVTDWTVDDVSCWLRGLGLTTYIQIFAENEIEGSHLPDLGKDDLLELGVTRVGHRLTIEKSLKKLLAK